MIKKTLLALAGLLLAGTASIAADAHSVQEQKQDITRHRALAGAHTAAANCLSAKGTPAHCQAALKSSCTGLGMGQYCGLKQDAWAQQASPALTQTAQAHLNMAACLEAGKPQDSCLSALQSACKGLALGKVCGMVHAH